jgi:hypothetical protein
LSSRDLATIPDGSRLGAMSRAVARLTVPNALADRPIEEVRSAVVAMREAMQHPAAQATRAALKRIAAGYPAPDVADPQVVVADMIAAIEDYPAVVVSDMADPKIGIVRSAKFPPRIAELVAWCENRLGDYRASYERAVSHLRQRELEAEWDRRAAQVDAERGAREARGAAAKEAEATVLRRLREMPAASAEPARPGESFARERWQADMGRAIRARIERGGSDVSGKLLAVLDANPGFCVEATREENMYRNSGWPKLCDLMDGVLGKGCAGLSKDNLADAF